MKLDVYLDRLSSARAQNRLLKFAVSIIALAVMVLGVFTYGAVKHQKVVVVPVGLQSQVWVGGNDASDEYIKHTSRYLALLLLHYTPTNAAEQFEDFMRFVPPERFSDFQAQLAQILDKVKMLNVTSVFHVQEVLLNRQQRQVEVKGLLVQYAGTTKAKEGPAVCRIFYRIADGRFWVEDVEQKL